MKTNLLFTLTFIFFTGYSYSQTSIATIESEMVLVEGGSMNLQGRLVTLPSYYCSKYEVTQRLFEEVMGYNPVTSPQYEGPLKPVINYNYPWAKSYFNWKDYFIFCNELNAYLNLPKVYYKDIELKIPYSMKDTGQVEDCFMDFNSSGYRFPISVEWEYAARGGQKSMNYTYSGSNNFADLSIWGVLQSVGTMIPNELGIYNMSGNAAEFTFDQVFGTGSDNCHPSQVWVGGGIFYQNRGGDFYTDKQNAHLHYFFGYNAKGIRLFKNKQ
ncbi:MAG TPA: SUMF1/EgtB/PvdO family nonheme iron enzyme [Saprospiraceae bacterium]|nr:SUMF1/EgtB/PvdO family nonheme iron enzyme [Saprospiraceae bacterium]HQN56096.1 SUMF1/EgtB/PvdO family nonheme iron enzyme [Saprospiraceae bacterium]HRN35138.1 SUMF1/EgtB/PvdO family nonheme iron enzyme [Saprospiraceae bacterium]HRP84397.1 SUMF1/EgtB/PvdO family nonheme iron enzyme [Saprospiraceae bacterium]